MTLTPREIAYLARRQKRYDELAREHGADSLSPASSLMFALHRKIVEIINREESEMTEENVMRQTYRVLSAEEKEQMQKVKDMGLEFHALVSSLGGSREIALAKTKIEEAVMWAVKEITG